MGQLREGGGANPAGSIISNPTSQQRIRWKPPKANEIKLNFDGNSVN